MAQKYKDSQIPDDVLDMFFKFLHEESKTTKKYYDVDPISGDKMQTREVTEERPTDLKSALGFFEKMYPQYFDKLTIERIKKLNKDTGEESQDKMEQLAREMFKVNN